MTDKKPKKVPPDGGYGWVVTFAYALNNVVVLPLIAGFGLVFQEAFSETGLTATQGTLVITLNHGFGMLLSFFNGPVLRRFGYRKVAVVGALFISSGLMITAVSSNFWSFIVSYSIINSIGIAAVMGAFSLAINSFFKEKRGRAVGIAMSLTGLGAIGTPLVMGVLIESYGWRYAVLILGAICLHSLLAACLLRPIKWYMVRPRPPRVVDEEMLPLNKAENDVELVNGSVNTSPKQNGSVLQFEMNGTSSLAKSVSMRSLQERKNTPKPSQPNLATSHPDVRTDEAEPPKTESKYRWWESQEINLGSSVNIFSEKDGFQKKVKAIKDEDIVKIDNLKDDDEKPKSLFQRFVSFFDLTLLKDPIFVNILIGLSLAGCVETNFSLLLPIILKDMLEFDTLQISRIMAVIGFSDTLFRLVSPFIGEWCHKPPRIMYMISLLIIILIRCFMLFTTSYIGMIFVALAMGITKGVRTVYMNIVIPSHVPIERLAFASGIQMFFNGIIIITIGSLLGKVREMSGSYQAPIIILNVVTFITVVCWSAEFLYFKFKKQPEEESESA